MKRISLALLVLMMASCGSGTETASMADSAESTSKIPSTLRASGVPDVSIPGTTSDDGRLEVGPRRPKDVHSRLEPVDAGPLDVVDLVLADAARSMGVALEKLRVSTVEDIEWPDASLGCPEPGRHYAQVVSRGGQIVVAKEHEIVEYRIAVDGSYWVCDNA